MSPMALQSVSMVLAPMRLRWALELGERHFNRIKVRVVRRQEEEPSSALLEGSLGLCALVAGEILVGVSIEGPPLRARCFTLL